ncbi:hypothetical protein [Streptomyces sp. NPDC058335]|uniref:hypothetical protein n=1 Tax=Streptomyces sp. NPDC058335 TaxID=3346451 RepID=UPI003666E22B
MAECDDRVRPLLEVDEVGGVEGVGLVVGEDRCFVIDAQGDPVSPSAITALVAARERCSERRIKAASFSRESPADT